MERELPKFKILLIGPSGVGKTSLLMKYVFNNFSYNYQVTTGIECKTKEIQLNEKNSIQLQIWDTMGQQAFKSVVKSTYKGVAAVLFLYSIQRKDSFQKLNIWVREVKDNVSQETVFFLVATKLDLEDVRKVAKEEGEAFNKSLGSVFFLEISSKTGENVKELFDKMAKHLFKKYQSSRTFKEYVKPKVDFGRNESFRLTKLDAVRQGKKKEGGCC